MDNKYSEIIQQLGGYKDNRGERRKLSETQLKRMEEDIGFSLPSDYREFLHDCGGGRFPSSVEFPLLFNQDNVHVSSVQTLFNFDSTEARSIDYYYCDLLSVGIMWDMETTSGVKLVKDFPDDVEAISWPLELLPIGVNAGSNWVCLALEGLRKGCVFFWVANGHYGENVYIVANSFDEFMHSLGTTEE